MYKPHWEVFAGTGWISVLASAGGQMFFSLSLGMAVMITYGSYLSKKESLTKNAIIVTICDTLVALMAGLAVFPAVFALGFEPAGGPGLLFITLQSVFNGTGAMGPVFGFLLDFIDKEVPIEGNQLTPHRFWNFCFRITAPIGMAMILLGQIDGFFGLGIFG